MQSVNLRRTNQSSGLFHFGLSVRVIGTSDATSIETKCCRHCKEGDLFVCVWSVPLPISVVTDGTRSPWVKGDCE